MATYHLWEGCPDNSPIWPASWYGAGAYRTILNEAITLNVYGWNIGTAGDTPSNRELSSLAYYNNLCPNGCSNGDVVKIGNYPNAPQNSVCLIYRGTTNSWYNNSFILNDPPAADHVYVNSYGTNCADCTRLEGCSDFQADNFLSGTAGCDDGTGYLDTNNHSCCIGCNDATAQNGNSNWGGCDSVGSGVPSPSDTSCCEYGGCMDQNANNYDPIATFDDGSCDYDIGCPDLNNSQTQGYGCDPGNGIADPNDFSCCEGCLDASGGATNLMPGYGGCDNNGVLDPNDYNCCSYNPIDGCMDQLAINYSPNSSGCNFNPNDFSCCNYNFGCLDPIATNYSNGSVGCDDGGGQPDPNDYNCCNYRFGCLDNNSTSNYDPNAVGCEYPLGSNIPVLNNYDCCNYYDFGCRDGLSANWAPNSDGCNPGNGIPDPLNFSCCEYFGCLDPLANNVQLLTDGCNPGNGIPDPNNYDCCIYNLGCTNSTGTNYDPLSVGCDDGTGQPLPQGNDNCCTGCPPPGGQGNGCVIDPGTGLPNPNDSSCCSYTFGCMDTTAANYINSDGCNDGTGSPDPLNFSCCEYFGCLDPLATNYNSTTSGCDNNGTPDPTSITCCIYPDFGCLDPNATNHDASADGCDDGNGVLLPPNDYSCCLYEGCTDQTATNYDFSADGCDPGTGVPDPNNYSCCTYPVFGCRDSFSGNVDNFDPNADGCEFPPNSGIAVLYNFDCCEYIGCADQTAINYNSNWDGCGSPPNVGNISCCSYPNYGCYDQNANNYQWWAVDGCDPSLWTNFYDCCTYNPMYGCDDPGPPWPNGVPTNLMVNSDGCDPSDPQYSSNIYYCCDYPDFGCLDPNGFNYDSNADGCDDGTGVAINTNYNCCEYEGCLDPGSTVTNYCNTCDGCEVGNTGVLDPNDYTCCTYLNINFGCMDSTLSALGSSPSGGYLPPNHSCNTTTIYHSWNTYAGPNVPNADGCDDGTGNPDINNFDCCNYFGCLDQNATNYDPNSDGCPWVVQGGMPQPMPTNTCCCEYPPSGCTDPSACNYDPNATVSNPSACLYSGCTDTLANNYDPNANADCSCVAGGLDDICCDYGLFGCLDNTPISTTILPNNNTCGPNNTPLVVNTMPPYVFLADNTTVWWSTSADGCDDGTGTADPNLTDCCTYYGCLDPTANNYTPTDQNGNPTTGCPVGIGQGNYAGDPNDFCCCDYGALYDQCHKCEDGFPIGNQVPAGTPCSSLGPGWIPVSQPFNPPCEPDTYDCDTHPGATTPCVLNPFGTGQYSGGSSSQNLAACQAGCQQFDQCKKCENGYPVGQLVPAGTPCSSLGPGWIPQAQPFVPPCEPDPEDIYCQCCEGGYPISMATTVPPNPGCSVLNDPASGITNCDTHPISGGPHTNPCKDPYSDYNKIYCQCCDGSAPISMANPVAATPGCSVYNGGTLSNCQTHPVSGGPAIIDCGHGGEFRGCMDYTADNYMTCCDLTIPNCVPNWSVDDCCTYKGCDDTNAINFGECCNGVPGCVMTVGADCCRYDDDPVPGCLDPTAINYMECCNLNPGCTPTVESDCCKYRSISNSDDEDIDRLQKLAGI